MLPLRPRWRENESPLSLFARGAALCNEYDVRNFAWRFGLELRDIAAGRATETLSKLTGHSVEAIAASSVSIVENRAFLRGQELRVPLDWNTGSSIVGGGRRFCPCCFSDDLSGDVDTAGPLRQRAFHRIWWDVTFITACIHHATPLQELCRRCGKKVGHRSSRLADCPSCGMSLASNVAPRLAMESLLADRYFMGRLGLSPSHQVDALDALPLYCAADLISTLGIVASSETKKPDLRKSTPNVVARTRSRGLALCADWPVRFDALLDDLLAAATPREGGPRGTYGPLYRRLVEKSGDDLAAPHNALIVDRLRIHALREVPFGASSRFLNEDVVHPRYLTFPHAAELRELNKEGFRKAATEAGLLSDDDRRLRRIRADHVAHLRPGSEALQVQELAAAAHVGHSLAELLSILGITRRAFRQLDRAGLIPKPVRYRWMDLWTRDQIVDFMDRCGVSTPAVSPKGKLRRISTLSTSMVTVLQAILDGRIEAKGTSSEAVGLGSILVEFGDLARLRETGSEDALALEEVAQRLKLTKANVGRLLARGEIQYRRGTAGNQKLVSRDEIEAFEENLIPVRELRSELDLPDRFGVRVGLASLGIHPRLVLGSTGNLAWYDRAAILADRVGIRRKLLTGRNIVRNTKYALRQKKKSAVADRR